MTDENNSAIPNVVPSASGCLCLYIQCSTNLFLPNYFGRNKDLTLLKSIPLTFRIVDLEVELGGGFLGGCLTCVR